MYLPGGRRIMRSSYRQRHNYGGTETALSGCVQLIVKVLNPLPRHFFNEKIEYCYKVIIAYQKSIDSNLKLKGHSSTKADKCAKLIQKDFKPFRDYIFELKKQAQNKNTYENNPSNSTQSPCV